MSPLLSFPLNPFKVISLLLCLELTGTRVDVNGRKIGQTECVTGILLEDGTWSFVCCGGGHYKVGTKYMFFRASSVPIAIPSASCASKHRISTRAIWIHDSCLVVYENVMDARY